MIAQQAQLPQVNIDSYGSGYLFLSSCALAGFIQLHAASLHNYIHMLRRSLGLRCLAESRGRNAHILFYNIVEVTLNWFLNSLNLILMPQYNLRKQLGTNTRILATFELKLQYCD